MWKAENKDGFKLHKYKIRQLFFFNSTFRIPNSELLKPYTILSNPVLPLTAVVIVKYKNLANPNLERRNVSK